PARPAVEHRIEPGNGLSRHDGWNPKRWDRSRVDAMKPRRGNTGNRHRVLVHQHLAAHDVLGASELAFPDGVREHNHRTRSRRLVIIVRQQPAERGVHSEYRKVSTRHELSGRQPGLSIRREVDRCRSTAKYAVEELLLLLEISA